ncbi:transglutaminase-like domain-containing protein [Entomospira nematocerorum]|uniref:Transglutaminase domain-containing protein n=1 Tax=Entomospira nematocerorum TaxID=2719987 RepID=A0A968KXI3_9SPIO|nr:transglutaminase-like domain-containing protein [Entomospira nematocera]NIZ46592.1 transglutaminase domain-containing protein [Entomospira nematocera]WDI33610.1 transglutaminase-like domain-containing protein [Entomospira nematocera]
MFHTSIILRTFILLYLYIHIIHLWQSAISLPFAIILFLLTNLTAIYVSQQISSPQRLRSPHILWLFTPLIFELIRSLLGLMDTIFAMYYPHLLIKWDLTFIPLRGTLYILFYSTLLFKHIPAYRLLEISLRPFLFILIFWEMRQFKLGIYSNLLTLLLSLILYSTMEISLLSQLLHPLLSKRKMLINTLKVIAFSLGASLLTIPWVYEKASPHMRSSEGLLRSNFTNFDFAESLKLESEISLGSKLLFLIQSDSIIPNGLLLKRLTMSGYSAEKGFFYLQNLDDFPNSKFGKKQNWPAAKHEYTQPSTMDIYLINMSAGAIVSPYEISSYNQISAKNMHQFKQIFRVEFYDIIPKLRATRSMHDHPLSAKSENIPDYVMSHNQISEEIRNLAKEVTSGVSGDYAKVKTIESYFHTNYYYSLHPGESMNVDQLHHFLFSSKKGYCSYFATAMALMLQSMDIVARVAGGFRVSTQNQVLNYYAVTSAESHSWVEVYFNDVGWIPFDPTPSQIYGNELMLASDNQNLTDIYRFIEQITALDIIDIPNIIKPFKWTYNELPKVSHTLFALLLIITIIIMLPILYILYKVYYFHYWLYLHHKKTPSVAEWHRCLLMWMHLLEHPHQEHWQLLLLTNDQVKSLIERIFFHPNPTISNDEYAILRQYIVECRNYYLKFPMYIRWRIIIKKSLQRKHLL